MALDTNPERESFEAFMRQPGSLGRFDLTRHPQSGYIWPDTDELFDVWVASRLDYIEGRQR